MYWKKRIQYNNHWPNQSIAFSGQEAFENLLDKKNLDQILKPIKLPMIEDTHFQRMLSFKIDIYEQLPKRPDIAFDLAWRTFEGILSSVSNSNSWSTTKTHKMLNKVCEDIFSNQYSYSEELANHFQYLLNMVPLQATEFLVKRLFEANPIALKPQQSMIVDRVKSSIGSDLYSAIEDKYSPLNSSNQRNAGLLFQLLIGRREVQINNVKYLLNHEQIGKLLGNGILYSYRNERFHGDSFSPFKSSKTSIKTYAHSYFCLISTYFFLAQLIYFKYEEFFSLSDLATQLKESISRYESVFSKYLKK